MNNDQQHKTYSAEDLIRYHRNELSNQEMHELEKAALDDPFLAEALDGYEHHTHSDTQPVFSLQKNGHQGLKGTLFNMNRKKMFYYAAAAVIFPFLFYGVYIFNTNYTSKSSVAENKNILLEKDTNALKILRADSMPNEKGNQNSKNEETETLSKVPMVEDEKSKSLKKTTTIQETLSEKNTESDASNVLKAEPVVVQENPSVQNGSIPAEVVSTNENKDADLTSVTVADKIKEENVETATEVVVTGYSTKNKKKIATSSQVISNNQLSNAAPVNGWSAFNAYISKEKKKCFDSQGAEQHGEVSLSFNINAQGKPKNIKAKSNLDKGCEDEAIRLLKQGPEWTPYSKKNVTVVITL